MDHSMWTSGVPCRGNGDGHEHGCLMPLPFPYGSDGDPTPRGVGFRLSPDLVMDFGDGVSHTMTIYEGYARLHAILLLIWLAVFFRWSSSPRKGDWLWCQRKLYCMSFDYDTKLKSAAESPDRFILMSSQTETSSLSAPYVSVTWVFFRPVSLAFKPVDFTTLLSSATWSVTETSARSYTPMSCFQAARPCSKGWKNARRKNWPRWLHPRWWSWWVTPPERKYWCELEVLSCSSQLVLADDDLDGELNDLAHQSNLHEKLRTR